MDPQLLGSHRSTYDAVFQHPIARNLQWRDLRAMLSALAETVETHGDNLKFTRNGQTLIVRPPRRKDFSDLQELMRVRHFLERSGSGSLKAPAEGAHLLVVIDHRQARIYKTELHGSVPRRVTPCDPDGARRHLHYVQDDSNGQRKPELKSFYEAVARTLNGAQKILVLGSSTGSSSAMDHLVAELKQHHPELARRVAGTIVVNEQHMSEDQLLAEARRFYAAADARPDPKRTSIMLSKDEISDGMTFILKLWDADGIARFWVETLRGDTAKRWFDIYRSSNWEALRMEARDVFHRSVTEGEAHAIQTSRQRCIYIQTDSINSDQLAVGTGSH